MSEPVFNSHSIFFYFQSFRQSKFYLAANQLDGQIGSLGKLIPPHVLRVFFIQS